jgi:tetratricopeptide (TPR) repeat protein
MATISLKDYLDKIKQMLRTGTPDEVIHHSRHILQYFPKNVEAYRYLGQGLLESGSVKEAGELFRRVLGVYPDDFTAHLGLSEVYERSKQPKEAIWHLERAFEQDPNNRSLTDKLRELYRLHYQKDHSRMQLTTGAVAQQYLRNRLYPQAIETLQNALARTPNRVDLRLLLARILWDNDQPVESAEAALDVLNTLPDCLEANRILTELWLSEQRPSDAQRYLNQIEAVDPYLALEIAQGSAPPVNTFTLQELDYRSIAERNLSTKRPDWLEDIGTESFGVASQEDWMSEISTVAADDAQDDETDNPLAFELPTDWGLDGLDDLDFTADDPVAPASPASPNTGLFAAFDRLNQAETSDSFTDELPADFASFDDADAAIGFSADDLPDFLQDSMPDEVLSVAALSTAQTDMLTYLGDEEVLPGENFPEGNDLLEELDFEALTEATSDDDDTPDWLKESGISFIDEAEAPDPTDFLLDDDADEMVFQNPTDDDGLAWLKGSRIEILDEESSPVPTIPLQGVSSQFAEEALDAGAVSDELPSMTGLFDGIAADGAEDAFDDDSLSWLQDDSLLDEALDIEALTSNAPLSDDLSFLTEATNEEASFLDFVDDSVAQSDQEGLDFLNDLLDEEAPDSESPLSSYQDDKSADWQSEMSDYNDTPPPNDWQPSDSDSELEGFEWLNEDEDSAIADELLFDSDDKALDWMAEIPFATDEPEATPQSSLDDNSFDWGTLDQGSGDAFGSAEDVPDWLSGMGAANLSDDASTDEAATGAEFDWLPDDADSEAFAATGGETPQELSEEDSLVDDLFSGDAPDWLGAAAPAGIAAASAFILSDDDQTEDAESESEFGWLDDVKEDVEDSAGQAEQFFTEDVPDWLAGAAPASEIEDEPESESAFSFDTTEDAEAESEFGWLDDVKEDAQETAEEAEQFFTEDVPDWLAGAAPVSEIEDEPESESAFSFDTTEDAESESEFGWLDDVKEDAQETAEEAEQFFTEDVPDWLAGAAPVSEIDDEPESESAFSFDVSEDAESESEFGWLNDVKEDVEDAAGQAEQFFTEDVPDWLAGAAPASEIDDEPESESAFSFDTTEDAESESEFGWLDDVKEDAQETAEEAEQFFTEDAPDWLAGAATGAAAGVAAAFAFGDDDDEGDTESDRIEDFFGDMEADAQSVSTKEGAIRAKTHDFGVFEQDDEAEFADPAQPVYEWESDDSTEWLSVSPDEPEDAQIPAAEMPNWLSQEADESDDDWGYAADEPEAETPATGGDVPAWLSDDSAPSDDEPLAEPVSPFTWEADDDDLGFDDEDAFAYESEVVEVDQDRLRDIPDFDDADDFDFVGDDDVFEDDSEIEKLFAAAPAPPPADNAPDWLNAMVPGLDMDFEATEDEPIETEYAAPTADDDDRPDDFNWLVNVVEEETSRITPIREDNEPLQAIRRFVFSRLPAWLRTPPQDGE